MSSCSFYTFLYASVLLCNFMFLLCFYSSFMYFNSPLCAFTYISVLLWTLKYCYILVSTSMNFLSFCVLLRLNLSRCNEKFTGYIGYFLAGGILCPFWLLPICCGFFWSYSNKNKYFGSTICQPLQCLTISTQFYKKILSSSIYIYIYLFVLNISFCNRKLKLMATSTYLPFFT